MDRLLYNFFIFLFKSGVASASLWNKKARLWIEGRKKFPDLDPKRKTIWMHCASLGEFEQGRPVLEALKKSYPNYPIVLSFFSPSGYEIRKNYPLADDVIYLPADSPKNAKKIVESINPVLVIWVKYEYWFNTLEEIHNRKIPLFLISGIFRKDQPFFKWYGGFWKKALSRFTHFFVQDETSLSLLEEIGIVENATLAGDTRFDRVIAIAEEADELPFIKAFIGDDRVFIAGSTWEKDENVILEIAHQHPDLKIIIAPHEIKKPNLDRIRNMFEHCIFYSELESNVDQHGKVLIMDNIGMLSRLYQYADLCYIGGGFERSGIHNTLEAAAYGKPVVFGPNYRKFNEAKELIKSGGAFSIASGDRLCNLVKELIENKNQLDASGVYAKKYVYAKRGATEKIMNYIKEKRLLTI